MGRYVGGMVLCVQVGLCISAVMWGHASLAQQAAPTGMRAQQKTTGARASNKGTPARKPTRAAVPVIRTPLSAQQVFDKYRLGVFTIRTPKAIGTGFAYSLGLVTCFHVIDGASSVTAVVQGKEIDVGRVWAMSKETDTVLLSAPDLGGVSLQFAIGPDIKVGDPVYVIGSPEGLEQTLTEGILSARRTVGGIEYLQLSAAVSPGSSGSPVFNKYGDVVGVVVSSIREGQQLNFAVTVSSMLPRLQGVAIQEIFRPDAGLSLRNTDVQKLLSVPQTGLRNIPDLALVVEDVPEALAKTVSKQDVQTWAEAELNRSGRIRLVSLDEQKRRFSAQKPPEELLAYMQLIDDFTRTLYVSVGYDRDAATGISWYSIRADFTRFGVIPGGLYRVNVWNRSLYGAFGSKHSADELMRNTVQALVRAFVDDWSHENK